MKIALKELKTREAAIGELMTTKLPITTSYKLSKIFKVIKEELVNLEETRVKLIKEYGSESESGDISVKDENMSTFMEEFGKLLNMEVEIDVDKISIMELNNAEISAATVADLDIFIKD